MVSVKCLQNLLPWTVANPGDLYHMDVFYLYFRPAICDLGQKSCIFNLRISIFAVWKICKTNKVMEFNSFKISTTEHFTVIIQNRVHLKQQCILISHNGIIGEGEKKRIYMWTEQLNSLFHLIMY